MPNKDLAAIKDAYKCYYKSRLDEFYKICRKYRTCIDISIRRKIRKRKEELINILSNEYKTKYLLSISLGIKSNLLDKYINSDNIEKLLKIQKDIFIIKKQIKESKSQKDKQISSIQRMKIMKEFSNKLNYAKKLFDTQTKKTLIFANTKEQADFLCENRIYSGIDGKKSSETLKNLKSGKLLKVSAVDQLSEGVTIPNLEIGIIMHAYGNNRKAAQKIGRFLRLIRNKTATIHILCYIDTVDEEWVKNSLSDFDQEKIQWIETINF